MANTFLHDRFIYQINSVAFDPRHSSLAAGVSDGTIRLFDLSTGNSSVLARYSAEILSIAYDPRRPVLAAGLSDGTIRLLDLDNNSCKLLKGHTGKVISIAYDRVREELASASFDGTIRIWELKNGKDRILERDTVKGKGLSYTPSMDCVVYSGNYLACCSRGGEIHIWNRVNKEHQILRGYWTESIALDSSGDRLFVGTLDNRIYIIDLRNSKEEPLGVFIKHGMPTIITTDIKRERIAIIESDGVYIWDIDNGGTEKINCNTSGIMTVAFDPKDDQIAIGYQDGKIRIEDIVSNTEVKCFGIVASD